MITDVVRVSQRFEDFMARRAVRGFAARAYGRIHLDQSPLNRVTELGPAFLGRPSGIARPDAGKSLVRSAVLGPSIGEPQPFQA
jgi:hypothetical protein